MSVLLISEGMHELGGALETLITRLNAAITDLQYMRISDPVFLGAHGKGARYFKRAVRCLRYAEERAFDAVILLIDQDGDDEREVQLSQAQEYLNSALPRAFGVAIRTFDAWMLADETALSVALEIPVQTQPDPERITDPKEACQTLLDKSRCALSQSDLYAALSQRIRLEVLERRCPDGFAIFAQRIREIYK